MVHYLILFTQLFSHIFTVLITNFFDNDVDGDGADGAGADGAGDDGAGDDGDATEQQIVDALSHILPLPCHIFSSEFCWLKFRFRF